VEALVKAPVAGLKKCGGSGIVGVVNVIGTDGYTALILAARASRPDIVTLIIEVDKVNANVTI
jgi:hypothetical protein